MIHNGHDPRQKRPKVLMYLTLLTTTGGGPSAATQLATTLADRGHEVEVFTRPPFDAAHRYARILAERGIRVHVFERLDERYAAVTRVAAAFLILPCFVRRGFNARSAWLTAKSVSAAWLARIERAGIRRRLARAIATDRPSILHVWGPAALTPLLLDWADRRDLPAVYHEMGEADEQYVETWSLQPTLERINLARAVICCSSTVADCIRSAYRYRGPVATVPFMVAEPSDLVAPRARDANVLTLGAIGRLVPHKRHVDLVRAVRALRDEGEHVRLVVGGSGPSRGDLERLCRDLGVQDRVEFIGEFEQLDDVMRRFDVFALTSSSESQCMPITESMAYGKPAIVSAIGGMPDFVEHGVTGFVVPLDDRDALVSAIRRFIAEPDLIDRMGAEARRRYCERYHPAAIANAIEGVYSGVMAATGRMHAGPVDIPCAS